MTLSEAARRSWTDPEIRARRRAGMLRAWEGPLRLALARSGRSDEELAVMNRERQRRWREKHR